MKRKLHIDWQEWQTIKPIPYKINWDEEWGCDVSDKVIREYGEGETVQAALLELTQSLIDRYQELENMELVFADDIEEFATLQRYLQRKG